jgi:hypothetical protein
MKSITIELKAKDSEIFWGDNSFDFKIYMRQKSESKKVLYFDEQAENQVVTVYFKEKTEKPIVGIVDQSNQNSFFIFDLTEDLSSYTKYYGIFSRSWTIDPIYVSLEFKGNLIKDEHYTVEVAYSDNDSIVELVGNYPKVWVSFKLIDKDNVNNGDEIKVLISNVENGLIATPDNSPLLNEITMTVKK